MNHGDGASVRSTQDTSRSGIKGHKGDGVSVHSVNRSNAGALGDGDEAGLSTAPTDAAMKGQMPSNVTPHPNYDSPGTDSVGTMTASQAAANYYNEN